MSQLKNNPDFILYYTDTDSAYTSKTLPAHLVDSKKLGLFKLEKTLTKFVSLGPKVYGGIDINGNEFVKTKGIKDPVSLKKLEDLLLFENINKVQLTQEKTFKSLSNATIEVRDMKYTLKPTNIKRNLIYKNGILVGTENIVINEE